MTEIDASPSKLTKGSPTGSQEERALHQLRTDLNTLKGTVEALEKNLSDHIKRTTAARDYDKAVNKRLDALKAKDTELVESIQASKNDIQKQVAENLDSLKTKLEQAIQTSEDSIRKEMNAKDAEMDKKYGELHSDLDAHINPPSVEETAKTRLAIYRKIIVDSGMSKEKKVKALENATKGDKSEVLIQVAKHLNQKEAVDYDLLSTLIQVVDTKTSVELLILTGTKV